MKSGNIIRMIAAGDGVSMTELANRVGISRQALYKRLSADMRHGTFVELLNALGYDLYYGKNGTVKKL